MLLLRCHSKNMLLPVMANPTPVSFVYMICLCNILVQSHIRIYLFLLCVMISILLFTCINGRG